MTIQPNKIGLLSKIFLIISSALLIGSIITPMWRIELNAPQYPEGLALLIYSNKLGGDVQIINGLNHYIGMKTLHAEEFIEFTILPYILGVYALACLLVVFIPRKKLLYTLFGAFVLFGIIAMADFWRWEYNYGHNLNPNAAIIVPGMAYQPPLIGYKQLLNFGAYSIPDIGGWLIVASGLLIAISILVETKALNKFRKKNLTVMLLPVLLFTIVSCDSSQPEPINLNSDPCNYCGMTISDPKFASELVTSKGRFYKFDDLRCMANYKKENEGKIKDAKFYVSNYLNANEFLLCENAILIQSEQINSPMGGNIAAFIIKDSADAYIAKYSAKQVSWKSINE